MRSRNYYELFGVSENATLIEIKKAYRQLAFKYHPDRNGGSAASEAKFKEINHAYDILSDIYQRTEYDRELKRQRNQQVQYTNTSPNTNSSYNHNTYQQPYSNKQQAQRRVPWQYYIVVYFVIMVASGAYVTNDRPTDTYVQSEELQQQLNQSANRFIIHDANSGLMKPDTGLGVNYFYQKYNSDNGNKK